MNVAATCSILAELHHLIFLTITADGGGLGVFMYSENIQLNYWGVKTWRSCNSDVPDNPADSLF